MLYIVSIVVILFRTAGTGGNENKNSYCKHNIFKINIKEPQMKFKKLLFTFTVVLSLVISSSVMAAGDYKWMENFNIRAVADPLGFRARLASRFKIGDVQIDAVISTAKSAADAYMVLRCGEMSGKSTNDVLGKYESKKNKGWGVFAKSLGIKPGSKEFQDLKNDNNFYNEQNKSQATNKEQNTKKGKKKGKNKN